jgi:Cap4 dsDNA endonuclease
MSEKNIAKSQLGGHSAIKGLTYQRDFIALLIARMICRSECITKIICEYRNDIEIQIGNELTSWQIKYTTSNSVEPRVVFDSIKLFECLDKTYEFSRFVLVSNRNFTKHNMDYMAYYDLAKFQDLKSKIEREFNKTLTETFLTKLRFMKGPELELIPSIISQQLSHFNKESIPKDLISFVDNIWIGMKDITLLELQEINERKNRHIDFKTITETRIKEEILYKNEVHTDHQFESGYGIRILMLMKKK